MILMMGDVSWGGVGGSVVGPLGEALVAEIVGPGEMGCELGVAH